MIKTYLKKQKTKIDKAIKDFLPANTISPQILHKAMRYSLLSGGKRIRPILCLFANTACNGKEKNAIPMAIAIECIHTYSLVHDDLPCMDNDDFRRGKPSCHKKFGENIAVLTGGALLTEAFHFITLSPETSRHKISDYIKEIALSTGSRNLIKGQVLDLLNEGKKTSLRTLENIHRSKSEALITSSLRLGAMSANASTKKLKQITEFGKNLGLAFQIIDDILDITETSKTLGKTAGKDINSKKSTYPAIIGLNASRKKAKKLTNKAIESISSFDKKANPLREIAQFLLSRSY